MTESINQSINQ